MPQLTYSLGQKSRAICCSLGIRRQGEHDDLRIIKCQCKGDFTAPLPHVHHQSDATRLGSISLVARGEEGDNSHLWKAWLLWRSRECRRSQPHFGRSSCSVPSL